MKVEVTRTFNRFRALNSQPLNCYAVTIVRERLYIYIQVGAYNNDLKTRSDENLRGNDVYSKTVI